MQKLQLKMYYVWHICAYSPIIINKINQLQYAYVRLHKQISTSYLWS